MKIGLAAVPLVLAGCLAHMPPDDDPAHLHIRWRSGFDQAAQHAAESRKPLLVCLVAGGIQDSC